MYLLNRFFYYGIIVPISLLPFRMLYAMSDGLYFFLYHIFRYRRKVVMSNLRHSFPEMTERERLIVAKKFFHHLCDLVVESLKVFTISDADAQSRVKYEGLEIMEKYYQQGRSVVMAMGHYCNWEIAAVTFDKLIKHHAIAIYKPLTNKYFDKKMISSRTKYGLGVMHNRKVREEFDRLRNERTAVVFLIDQAPSAHSTPQWVNFLNQETAVLTGIEKYATEYNYPVLYLHMDKPRRGFYNLRIEDVFAEPRKTRPGEITEVTTRILEGVIRTRPELWLWSHRRWKRGKSNAD